MSYIHEKLKEALGGTKAMNSKNSVIRDWTPNNIKVLIVAKGYILVVHHTGGFGGVKIVPLDISRVQEDLQNVNISKLNSILKRRSLSCMEEFYVDSIYLNIIDLVGYIKDLVNTSSRLRYFGYGDFSIGSEEWLKNAYNTNKKNLDYSIALDNSKPINIEYRSIGCKDWYKNYYLRPQYYKLDEDNGKLALHFRKFEEDYKNFIITKNEFDKIKILEDVIKEVVSKDINNISYLRRFDNLLSILSKGSDDLVKAKVLKVCKDIIKSLDCFTGLRESVLSPVLENSEDFKYLCLSYERYGVLDKSNTPLDREKLLSYNKKEDGFISLKDILDNICLECCKVLTFSGYKDLVGMALIMSENVIPNGNLRNNYIKKETNCKSIEGYFTFLSEIIGVSL